MTQRIRVPPIALQRAGSIAAAAPGSRADREPTLARVRHGVYAASAALEAAEPASAFLARIRAVDAVRDRPTFARESALALHAVPYGLEPTDVHTIGGASTARRKAGVTHTVTELEDADLTTVDGLSVCSLAYALADVARRRGPLVAVAAIDAALRDGRVTKDEVTDALGRQSKRGRAAAEWAVEFADGASESVGESYSRVRIHQLGFAAPVLQVNVVGRSDKGYRVDMGWKRPGRRPLFGEFDGMQKYGELANQVGRRCWRRRSSGRTTSASAATSPDGCGPT